MRQNGQAEPTETAEWDGFFAGSVFSLSSQIPLENLKFCFIFWTFSDVSWNVERTSGQIFYDPSE